MERQTAGGIKYSNFVLETGYKEIISRLPAVRFFYIIIILNYHWAIRLIFNYVQKERSWTKLDLAEASDLLHRICTFLLTYKEDDTTALCVISKVKLLFFQ